MSSPPFHAFFQRARRASYLPLALLALSSASFADEPFGGIVLFDGGATEYNYGTELSSYSIAEDFFIPPGAAAHAVKFWTIEGYGLRENALPFDGHIDYAIYESVDGSPAATPVVSGVAESVVRDAQGLITALGNTKLFGFENSFYFETPFISDTDQVYFLSLHILDHYPDEPGEFYWATAEGPVLMAPSHSQPGGTGPWHPIVTGTGATYGAGHLAFQIISVPEPATGQLLVALATVSPLLPGRNSRRRRPR